MVSKFMYIPNDDTKSNPFGRIQLVVKKLDIKINEQINHNLIKVPKVDKPTNHKPLGTSVINSPISPPSMYIS